MEERDKVLQLTEKVAERDDFIRELQGSLRETDHRDVSLEDALFAAQNDLRESKARAEWRRQGLQRSPGQTVEYSLAFFFTAQPGCSRAEELGAAQLTSWPRSTPWRPCTSWLSCTPCHHQHKPGLTRTASPSSSSPGTRESYRNPDEGGNNGELNPHLAQDVLVYGEPSVQFNEGKGRQQHEPRRG